PRRYDRLNVSATTPSPGNAASPCTSTGSTLASLGGALESVLSARACWSARATPSTTGFTISRWLGFGSSTTCTDSPVDTSRTVRAPRWYLTSPVSLGVDEL